MIKGIQRLCAIFYLSILFVLIAGCFGAFDNLYASAKVIETFEAGPIKTEKKYVVKVKSQFSWDLENPCQCDGEGGPCIKSFLDKNQPPGAPKDIQTNENLNQNSEKYQGSSLVPTTIQNYSVRIISVPFCRQSKSKE